MALDLTAEQKTVGTGNFQRVVGKLAENDSRLNRREFMQGLIGAGSVLPLSAAAFYGYGRDAAYRSMRGTPVKAGLIGCGDEGGVLASEHDPEYVNIIAVSDIRPTNITRIFEGEGIGSRRRGLKYHYGSDAQRSIRVYERYQELLANPEIEMVIIALPLNLHFRATMDAFAAGKHVLCEKLMAWNIDQCKKMIRDADDKQKLLSIGHQRHYSMLYAHANEVVQSGVLGDIRHIRALWHRNNTTPKMANGQPVTERINGVDVPVYANDGWRKDINPTDRQALENTVRNYGWKNLNELVRWRLFRRTGGGLMAELGSHQLDACSIFLGKVKPISVTAVGGKNFYRDDREVEDHVYCTFEFPGKNYDPAIPPRDEVNGNCNYNDIVTVTYSSLSTNAFESYGECVMGSKGTLITEMEQRAYLFGGASRSTEVTATSGAGRPALDAAASGPPADNRRAQEAGAASLGAAISYGYKEEMSHLAFCIRARNQGMDADRRSEALKPRCDGRAAMADAILALTANQAMRRRERIAFRPEWFDASKDDVPDPDMVVENI